MLTLMALFFGAGGSALISVTFQNSLLQEKRAAQESYRMILNTLQVVNSMDSWSDEKDISETLEQLSAQDAFGAALQLHSETKTLYSKGPAAAHFVNLTGQTDTTHLACTIFSTPEAYYYLQLSGSFYIDKDIYYLDAAYNISSIYETRRQQQEIYQYIFIILLAA